MEKMVVLRQSLLFQQVCAELAPKYIDPKTESHPTASYAELGPDPVYSEEFITRFNDMLLAHGLAASGTTGGWRLLETCPAAPCADYPDRYHYICVC